MSDDPASSDHTASEERADPGADAARLRNRLASERTLLAVERTYAGWMRTGLGAIAIAIGTHAALDKNTVAIGARLTASVFLLVALLIFAFGHRQAKRLAADLAAGRRLPQVAHFTRVTALFIVATFAVAALIWLV